MSAIEFSPNAVSLDGWLAAGETFTYASSTTFTVAGDRTVRYSKGTRIKLTQSTVKYFVVTLSAFSAGVTTVTITGGTDYTLANAVVSDPFYSYAANPQGYPRGFNYTPTFTGFSANPATSVYFSVQGTVVTCVFYPGSNGTSNANSLTMSLPIAVGSGVWTAMRGFDNGVDVTNSAMGLPSGSTLTVYKDWAGGGWTTSGAKQASGTITYIM
jgi:hypothetical protein